MRSQRGAVLIMTLVALTGLIAMVATFAATQRTSFQSRHNRLDQMRAEQMVDAGVQRALAELSIVDGSQPTTLQDDWAALGTLGDEKFIVGNGSFRIELVDGSSRIDLNSAPAEQLTKLNLTTEQIDSLLDWREAGQNPRQEGAKDEYYNTMTTPYNAALAPFKTVEELLLVKGFTGRSLYEIQDQTTSDQVLVSGDTQEPVLADVLSVGASSKRGNIPNIRTAPNLQAILRIVPNVQVATAVFNGRQGFNTTADMLRVAGMTVQIAQNLLDSYTVNPPNGDANDAGRLNINTATEAVLNSLPESTPDLTAAILQQQATGITSLGGIARIPGITLPQLQQWIDRLTVNSQTFIVRVAGTYGNTTLYREVTIELGTTEPKMTQITRPFGDNLLSRWGWQEEPLTDVTLAEAS